MKGETRCLSCEDGEYVVGDECVPCGDTVNEFCIPDPGDDQDDEGKDEEEEPPVEEEIVEEEIVEEEIVEEEIVEEEEEEPVPDENSAPYFIDYDPFRVYEVEQNTERTVKLPIVQD